MFTAAFLVCLHGHCKPIRHWRRFETRLECVAWVRTEVLTAEAYAATLGLAMKASGGCVGKREDV